MNYAQAVSFHESAKDYGSILGLSGIKELMHELNDVWKELKIVHIAGTNGKGSVSCFLASVLKEAGYLVGQFNSPAVFDLREVYQINQTWISKEEYASCMEEVAASCKKMTEKGRRHPTVFEVETALAFLWFYRRKCDIVLLETGMGGSTDATNIIQKPLCSVFVSIQMDHMAFLGNTLREIAKIKAGIIKDDCPAVTVRQPKEVETVLRQTANARHAAFYTVPELPEGIIENDRLCYPYPDFGKICLSMTGNYQIENSALAIATLQVLREAGFSCTDSQIKKGIESAKWAGRFECLGENPCFYIDGAHNPAAAGQLAKSLSRQFQDYRKIGIMGVMADKNYGEMLDILLPYFQKIYTVTPDQIRSLPAETLAQEIKNRGGAAWAKDSIYEAVAAAVTEASEDSSCMTAAFGSLYFLNEVKQIFYEITGR